MPQWPDQRTFELLTLLQAPRIGPVRALEILKGSPTGSLLERMALPDSVRRDATSRAESIIDQAAKTGVEIVGFGDDDFPPRLRSIPDPPPILYVRGNHRLLTMKAVAVVGTRHPSQAGISIARAIGTFVSQSAYAVVSGLALGIDTAAHLGALDVQGVTVAVLAHGLDTVSPPSNRALAERILENGGALVSEHPPGAPAFRSEFVRRNRIQSGLSLASIIVESGVDGGAIHQARFTTAQGRRLFTVGHGTDGSTERLDTSGAEYLLETFNATVLKGIDDLRSALDELAPNEGIAEPEKPVQTALNW